MRPGDRFTFTIDETADGHDGRISVNYDAFVDDVVKDDVILVDGGMMAFRVIDKSATDVEVEVVDGGALYSFLTANRES